MSRPRFNWWPFALNMIRDYPIRKKEMERAPHNAQLRQEQREYDAVHKAIEYTRTLNDGRARIRMIELTLWKRTYTIDGAAGLLNLSERTAQRYRWQFVVLMGHAYGFLTDEEYRAIVDRETGNEKRNPRA